MKRLILLLICALYVTTAAQAQISFYGEWCRKGSGEKTIMIFDMKEKKAYVMNEARKTCMVMEEIDKFPPISWWVTTGKCLTLPPESFWAWRR